MTPPQAQRPDNELVDALVRTAFTASAVLSRVAAEHDLSLTQLRLLGILRDRRARMSTLADFLGLERSTVSGLIDRAEHRGLVRREAADGDGRAVEVFLSPAGLDLAERVQRSVGAGLRSPLSRLGDAERRRLRILLERMLGDPTPPADKPSAAVPDRAAQDR